MDLENPNDSLLIQKPMAESQGGLPHGGHDKFVWGDRVHSAFLHFISRYAACADGTTWTPPELGGAPSQ